MHFTCQFSNSKVTKINTWKGKYFYDLLSIVFCHLPLTNCVFNCHSSQKSEKQINGNWTQDANLNCPLYKHDFTVSTYIHIHISLPLDTECVTYIVIKKDLQIQLCSERDLSCIYTTDKANICLLVIWSCVSCFSLSTETNLASVVKETNSQNIYVACTEILHWLLSLPVYWVCF